MDTPRIALRFRDTTPGVGTIAEHRSIIASEGAVWWGWWRKEFEPEYSNLFADLAEKGDGYIYLLDRSMERCFKAHYLQAFGSSSRSIDSLRVPEYYREQLSDVSAWFLLDDIRESTYLDDIGRRLGETTLLILDHSESAKSPAKHRDTQTIKRSGILHLSDLHFGSDYAFLPPGETASLGSDRSTLTRCLIEDLSRINALKDVGIVLVTGDFTTRGDWTDATRNQIIAEFQSLRDALEITQSQIITIPGNHDIVRYPPDMKVDIRAITVKKQTTYQHEREYRTFIEELTGRNWRDSLNFYKAVRLSNVDIFLCALNSCTIAGTEWTEYGYVGVSGLDVLNEVTQMVVERPTYRLMALHHHLIPVNQVEMPNSRGVSLTLDAVQLLDAAQQAGIHVALHGHQHLPRVVRYERLPLLGDPNPHPLLIISGGSAGVVGKRRPGSERNTYSLLRFDGETATLKMRELRTDAREGATLFDGRLPLVPAQAKAK